MRDLLLLASLLSFSVLEASAAEKIVLKKKSVSLGRIEKTKTIKIVRNSKTPKIITFEAELDYYANSCVEHDWVTYYGQDESCGYETLYSYTQDSSCGTETTYTYESNASYCGTETTYSYETNGSYCGYDSVSNYGTHPSCEKELSEEYKCKPFCEEFNSCNPHISNCQKECINWGEKCDYFPKYVEGSCTYYTEQEDSCDVPYETAKSCDVPYETYKYCDVPYQSMKSCNYDNYECVDYDYVLQGQNKSFFKVKFKGWFNKLKEGETEVYEIQFTADGTGTVGLTNVIYLKGKKESRKTKLRRNWVIYDYIDTFAIK